MTIGGALSDLNNLLNADDIPCYYKPSIKAIMDTIALEQESVITKHPVEFKEEGYEDRAEMHPICPNCKEYLDNEKWGFCPYCGISIEWE